MKSRAHGPADAIDPRPQPLQRGDALFLDFDGTLVPLARAPDLVVIDRSLPYLLKRVAAQLQGALAVVSGRPLKDLLNLLDPYRGAAAGTHGIERLAFGGTVIRPGPDPAIEMARSLLRGFAATTPGVMLEDKDVAVALHFRANPRRAFACLEVAREAARLAEGRLSVIQGKMVVELRPVWANKGKAIQDFMSEAPFRGRRPVFIGDDRTDEDGFAVVNDLGGVSIHVGTESMSAAPFRLPSVAAVLQWISEGAPASPPPGRPVRTVS